MPGRGACGKDSGSDGGGNQSRNGAGGAGGAEPDRFDDCGVYCDAEEVSGEKQKLGKQKAEMGQDVAAVFQLEESRNGESRKQKVGRQKQKFGKQKVEMR